LQQTENNKIFFNRIYFLVGIIFIFWVFLEVRLYNVQIKNQQFYLDQSALQAEKKIIKPAFRGIIYDRNRERLATNLNHYDLGVDLSFLKNKEKLIDLFQSVFRQSRAYYVNKLKGDSRYVPIARKVSDKIYAKFKDLDEPGLVIENNFRRHYPFDNYGSQVIGFTDIDDRGASGIELQYDDLLKGKDGWTILQRDAKKRLSYSAEHPIYDSESGADIYLTLDKNYETIVEDRLREGVEKYNAQSGMAILMDPETSEILAMCSYPSFNPNKPANSKPEYRKNRTISDVFEPGSTFKLFPAAALLQEGNYKQDSIIYCENGSYKYYDHLVRDSKKHGWLTLRSVFENSSNIGMVKSTVNFPKNVFYKYLKEFGFGTTTGVGLTGENSGSLSKPENFSGISKGMISHGYEIGTTALQITNAYCAVVNGGELMRPYLVQKVVDRNGEIIEETKPEIIRTVISEGVADAMKNFMIGAIERGTGKSAHIEGMEVGGKTGRAQKYDEQRNHYKPGAYIASFIGFAPKDNPEFVLAIFLDEPRPKYYGGETAAPIFKSIMEHLLKMTSGSKKSDNDIIITATETDKVPNFTGMPASAIQELLAVRDLDYEYKGEGFYIISQKLDDGDLIFELGNPVVDNSIMPDLRGLSIREALKKIDFSKVKVKIEGIGKVKAQTVKAGTKIGNSLDLLLSCSN